jgi:hypothetical protein
MWFKRDRDDLEPVEEKKAKAKAEAPKADDSPPKDAAGAK